MHPNNVGLFQFRNLEPIDEKTHTPTVSEGSATDINKKIKVKYFMYCIWILSLSDFLDISFHFLLQDDVGTGRAVNSMDWGEVCYFLFLQFMSISCDKVFDQLRKKELQTLGNRLKCSVFK